MAESAKRVHIEKAQNFMRQYRDPESRELKKLSANQFMDVWSHYDRDGKCVSSIFNIYFYDITYVMKAIVILKKKMFFCLFFSI